MDHISLLGWSQWKISREETSTLGLEITNLQKSIPGPFKCFWAFCLGIFYFLFFFIWKLAQENLGSSDYSSSDGEESFPQLSKQANKKFKAVGSDIEEGDEEHEEEGDEEKDEEEDEEEDEEKNAENSGQSEGEMETKAKPKRKTKEKSKRNSKEKSKEKSKPKEQKSKHSTNKNSKHSTKKSKSKK